jgi:hypothetical protein
VSRNSWESIERRLILDPVTGCRNLNGIPGYGRGTYAQIRYGGKKYHLHVFIWIWYKGRVPKRLRVLHTCDNRRCGEIMHLFVGTHQQNMDDMVAKGRSLMGDRHPNAKISSRMANRIRVIRRKTRLSQYDLSNIFGLTQSSICAILNNVSYAR